MNSEIYILDVKGNSLLITNVISIYQGFLVCSREHFDIMSKMFFVIKDMTAINLRWRWNHSRYKDTSKSYCKIMDSFQSQ